MKDYSKEITFWIRLNNFISDVNVDSSMFGEEEKQMILSVCDYKINNEVHEEE